MRKSERLKSRSKLSYCRVSFHIAFAARYIERAKLFFPSGGRTASQYLNHRDKETTSQRGTKI